MKTALAAEEVGLRTAVAPVGVATPVAPLRGMPGIDGDHLAAESLGLVLQEALKLGEAPRVKPALGFPPAGFNPGANIGQVLNHDSSAWLNALKDRTGDNVIAVPSESLFTTSEASKMPLGALGTIGLQVTLEAEDSLNNFLHVPVAVEAIVGSNGRPGDAEVNAYSLTTTDEGDIGQGHHDVEIETSLTENKVGGGGLAAGGISDILRQVKRNPGSPPGCSQVDESILPVHLEGMQVVAWRAKQRLRTSRLFSLLLSGDGRPDRLTSFVYALNMQIGDKGRKCLLIISIYQALKRIGIAVTLLPSYAANGVESLCKLPYRFMKGLSLFFGRLKKNSNCPIHYVSLPHSTANLQIQGREEGQFPCRLKATAPLP